jgi:putative DNA primase/helicase
MPLVRMGAGRGSEALDEATSARRVVAITKCVQSPLGTKMGCNRKLSTAEVTAAVERAFARQKGREPMLPTRTDNPVIGELASLHTLEYELWRDTVAAGLGIRVSALDKLVKGRRAVTEDENTALPHWNVEPSAEPVDGAALLNNLRQVFRRYVVLPKGADIALPLWVLHAWTMDAGDISPLMVLVSPTKRCGKTSVLIVLYFLTPRSELSSNITAPALFRYIENVRPTLLIDEADSFAKDNEELRGILNSGHTKAAANVIRNIDHKPRRFSTWAPKAIATIRILADTLEDRAIVVRLQRKPPVAKVERLRRRDNADFAALRSQAARWTTSWPIPIRRCPT